MDDKTTIDFVWKIMNDVVWSADGAAFGFAEDGQLMISKGGKSLALSGPTTPDAQVSFLERLAELWGREIQVAPLSSRPLKLWDEVRLLGVDGIHQVYGGPWQEVPARGGAEVVTLRMSNGAFQTVPASHCTPIGEDT